METSEYESENEGRETSSRGSGKFFCPSKKQVHLNRFIIMKGISNVNCDKRENVEIDEQFPSVTHLHLQRKGINILGSLHHFLNLTVLYLYDNQIQKIEGLEDAKNLEALYLQQNQIQEISGLHFCKKLRKLYLGQNEIMVIEGLHNLIRLKELHVEDQRLKPHHQIVFDPMTLDTLANCLTTLNINGNNITNIEDLAGMMQLETLEAQRNLILDLDKTSFVLSTLQSLKSVDFRGNPMTKSPKYKEKIIGYSRNIEELDRKFYSSTSRDFISKFCQMKANNLRRSLAKMDIRKKTATPDSQFPPLLSTPSTSLTSDTKTSNDSLTFLFPPPGQRAGWGKRNSIGWSPSLDSLQPESHGIQTSTPTNNVEKSSIASGDGPTPNLNLIPKPKVMTFPPWPHILRGLNSTEQVTYMP